MQRQNWIRGARLCSMMPVWLVLLLSSSALLKASDIDFEGLPDSTILTTQYPGLTFSNAIVLTAGISLNEFEFPPHSGSNVASDNGGPISILFSSPISSFGGYFTYAEPLTAVAFGSGNNQVASATSSFSNNEALSGDLGSSPNEFLSLTFPTAIWSITITGDPAGSSFVLDDMTYGAGSSPVPEPRFLYLCAVAMEILAILRLRKSQSSL